MNEKEFLAQIDNLRVWQRNSERAPHKPLLILLALARLHNGQDRYIPFDQVSEVLGGLLRSFGPKRRSHHPEQPFLRLEQGIWKLTDANGNTQEQIQKQSPSKLRANKACGGFSQEAFQLLNNNPTLVCRLAMHLLKSNFPESYHYPILEQLNFLAPLENPDSITVATQVRTTRP